MTTQSSLQQDETIPPSSKCIIISSNLLSILINLAQSEQARLCPKAVLRIRGSEHAFRKQICVSINLPEVSFFYCLPIPRTMFQHHLGVSYYYPHMLLKTATQNCISYSLHFISFSCSCFSSLVLFFFSCLTTALVKKEKKGNFCFLNLLTMCSSPNGCCNSVWAFEVFPFKKTKQKFSERHTHRWKKKINQELISHWNTRKTSPNRIGHAVQKRSSSNLYALKKDQAIPACGHNHVH